MWGWFSTRCCSTREARKLSRRCNKSTELQIRARTKAFRGKRTKRLVLILEMMLEMMRWICARNDQLLNNLLEETNDFCGKNTLFWIVVVVYTRKRNTFIDKWTKCQKIVHVCGRGVIMMFWPLHWIQSAWHIHIVILGSKCHARLSVKTTVPYRTSEKSSDKTEVACRHPWSRQIVPQPSSLQMSALFQSANLFFKVLTCPYLGKQIKSPWSKLPNWPPKNSLCKISKLKTLFHQSTR